MLFVSECSHISDEISVTDTDDGITESYTANEVYEFAKRVKIKGVKDGKITPISQSALAKKLYERYKLIGLLPSGSTLWVGNYNNVAIDMPEVEDFSGDRVRVPYGVDTVGCECFNRYSSLRHLELPQSIQTIESGAFHSCGIELNCLSLQNLVHVGDEAFLGCYNIKSLVLGEKVLFVGTLAFAQSGVERIEFRSKDLILREKAFFNCKQLKEIVATEDAWIKSSDMFMFANCTSLEKVDLNFCSRRGFVPASCFEDCSKLSQVVNADKINQINAGAFEGCSSLKSFDFSNISMIFGEGFRRSGLRSIYCPKLTFIGSLAFEKTPLQGVVIEGCDEELELGNYAFSDCNKLSSFHYRGVVIKAISVGCFKNCSSLKDIDLGTKVECIGDSAFKDCVSLEDLGRLQVIGECENEAFRNTSLKHLDITYEFERIGKEVFRGCKQLEDVSISIRTIGYNMFHGCIKLERFDWRLPYDAYGHILKGAFKKCKSLKEFKLPRGVLKIDKDAFESCDELSQVYIPRGVDLDSIKGAFESCPKVKFIPY